MKTKRFSVDEYVKNTLVSISECDRHNETCVEGQKQKLCSDCFKRVKRCYDALNEVEWLKLWSPDTNKTNKKGRYGNINRPSNFDS